LRAPGQGSMMVDIFLSEARRRILHICEYDFGEADRFDDDGDFEGSEALEKRVTRLDRKHDHAHAAFTRLLQVDLSSALECLYKGAGYEHATPAGGGAASGSADGATCAMAAVAMAGAVHAEADSAVWRRSYMHLVKTCSVRASLPPHVPSVCCRHMSPWMARAACLWSGLAGRLPPVGYPRARACRHGGECSRRRECRGLTSGERVQVPYIRACFHILAREFQAVLLDEQVALADRVACAARFLNDEELAVALESLTLSMVSKGRLEGLLLTGLTPAAEPLLCQVRLPVRAGCAGLSGHGAEGAAARPAPSVRPACLACR
jgi:hypothetical protein